MERSVKRRKLPRLDMPSLAKYPGSNRLRFNFRVSDVPAQASSLKPALISPAQARPRGGLFGAQGSGFNVHKP
jgi:hypothetical protein